MNKRKSLPYISIVVCVYNGEATLQLTIDSLIDQNYPKEKYEIIFIDDGSTDKSSQICQERLEKRKNKYPAITYAFQKNGGLSLARNTGIHIAKGKVIAYIDQDAVATKSWIFDIAKEFELSNVPQIIGGPVLLLNENSRFASLLYDSIFSYLMKSKHLLIGTNMAFSRSLLEKIPFHPVFDRRGDETYIFDKLKPYASPMQISGAAVYHETPESLKAWLKTRYENGYFIALLTIMNANHLNGKKALALKVLNRFLFIITPMIVILSLITQLHLLMYLGIFLYSCIAFRRYLATGYLIGLMKHFWSTRKANLMTKLSLIPIILLLVLLGKCYEDFGYFFKILSSLNEKHQSKSEIFNESTIIKKVSNFSKN